MRKEEYVRRWLRSMERRNRYGVYFIFRSMEQGRTFRCTLPKYRTKDPNHRILAPQRSRFTHYYFYIRDEVLGPIVIRVATFFPFQTTYWLNGHSFMEQELNRAEIGFRKNDNAFLAVDDVKALQATADRLSPEVIHERLDDWTLILGPKFSQKERKGMNLRRFYAIAQIEYCRNFVFKRHFPIHKIFERSCELGLWRMTAHKISEIFGTRLTKRLKGKLHTTLEQLTHGHHASAPIGSTASPSSTRNSPPSCATRSARITCRTSGSEKASAIWPPLTAHRFSSSFPYWKKCV